MIVRPTPLRPVMLSIAFSDRKIIDTRNAADHQPILVEFPILVAVPVAAIVVPLERESDRDGISPNAQSSVMEPVPDLLGPLARQEFHDRISAN